MAMNFFAAQESARRRTQVLVLLLIIATIVMVILVNLSIMVVAHFTTSEINRSFLEHFDWDRFIGLAIGMVTMIGLGSLIRTWSLRNGGEAVADSMNARLVSGRPRNILERRLLNIAEEMAIASGIAVPQIYIMDQEDGINAFAAGFTPGDAVIVVTRGAVEKLQRDELQGIIGHEFSHILNGDMRLNTRLIGLVFGILMIASTGRLLYRLATYEFSVSGNHFGQQRHNGIGLGILPLLLSIGLLIFGYLGLFLGNLIKAAVSRQREYLADAAAVQFTRNPLGIAGALKKIGGAREGSWIRDPNVEELSHAYFEEGIHYRLFNDWFATHPPLEERIVKLDPAWDGRFPQVEKINQAEVELSERQRQRHTQRLHHAVQVAQAVTLGAVLENLGQAGHERSNLLATANDLLTQIPDYLRDGVTEPYGARALVYALVLDTDNAVLEHQLAYLKKHADPGVSLYTREYIKAVHDLDRRLRLPLIDMAMPALRQLSRAQYRLFKNNFQALILMDERISPLEWTLEQIVFHHLDVYFEHRVSPLGKYEDLKRFHTPIIQVLSFLAHNTHDSHMQALHAIQAGLNALGLPNHSLPQTEQTSPEQVQKALQQLLRLTPRARQKLLEGCAQAVAADDKITAEEHELLRAFASLLDSPMPPLPQTSNMN